MRKGVRRGETCKEELGSEEYSEMGRQGGEARKEYMSEEEWSLPVGDVKRRAMRKTRPQLAALVLQPFLLILAGVIVVCEPR